jgi:hypothetical protein
MDAPQSPRNPNDYNQTAAYAAAIRAAGGRMSLQPKQSQPKEDLWGDAGVDNDVAKWYETNPNRGIDLSREDAKEHWEKLVEGMGKRHTDWLELIGETGSEIAKLPMHLVEGIVEDPNPVKVAGGVAEGVVRSLRDMYGMFAESENPTSPLFKFRSLIGAVTSGKVSKNWREEAEQWNHARRFLWDSNKIMQGDMSVYEALPYVNMDNDTAETLRSFRNPKVAHAMSFLGLELGSMVAAPFTGGASAALGVAGATNMASATARTAARASAYARVMGTLTDAGKKFDALAHGAALRTTGTMATAASKAISIPANMVEGLVGGNIDAIAGRAGINSAHARNMAATQAINGLADIGAGEVRQTVGYLGSLGLRTTAELLGEFGEQASLLAQGVVTADQINGLTVIERVAGNKLMSRSAQNAAKAINVTVDPILQMSTAALKHAYKDSLFFAGLGYMNDRERGAVGGATMGMVWGGYSGAFRHLWANVSGGVQHENYVRDFDTQFMTHMDRLNPELAGFFRTVMADTDLSKSTKASANARQTAQFMHLIMDPQQKRKSVGSALPYQQMKDLLLSKGLDDSQITKNGRGAFMLVQEKATGEMVPVVWMNPELYRPADFGHEVLGHLLVYNLTERNQIGRHLLEFYGTGENKGVISDKFMAESAALRRSLEVAVEQLTAEGIIRDENPNSRAIAAERARQIYAAEASQEGSFKYFEESIKNLRNSSYGSDIAAFSQIVNGEPRIYSEITRRPEHARAQNPLKYMFEEFVSGHAEKMFVHTNLQDLVMPDADKPLRMYFERKFTERLSRTFSELELAGVRAKLGPLGPDGRPTIQAEIYDDGVYRRHPAADGLLKNMVQSARSVNDAPVHQLSPEMQLAVAKKHRKEFLFNISGNGATFKGEKERNDMSAKSAEGAFKVFDALPDELKPKFTVDEHGNRSADVYTMKDEVLDALVTSGYLDAESAQIAKAFRDTYLGYESSGFTTPNMFYGQALNASHRTVSMGNLFKRIFGEEVPVTHRVFVPFELKVSLRTTDAQGRQLRAPRGGFLTTVVDYTAIHRRQLKMWARPDVKAFFSNIGEFNEFFHVYMMNMLREPSARVDSATLFRPKFGENAEKVRDIMYETFGASKRKDESYFNAPREGYMSDHEDPNFPIHSMRLENLIGVEKLTASPFPYHHGRSYEPLRRNLSTAGFEEVSANVFASGQGYRVIRERSTSGGGWKVFSPFGGMVGRYNEKDKAFKAAQKHLRKAMNPADILALPTEEGWEQMSRPERLRSIQEQSYKAKEYHEAKAILANNTSLNLAPVVAGGKMFVPKWVDEATIGRLYKSILDGLPVAFGEFLRNNDELKSYQDSNKISYNLGIVRIMPNQDKGYAVHSKYVGKSVKLMPHPTNGEIMVYVDKSYYDINPSIGRDFLLQDIQSEIQHVVEAVNAESVTASSMTLEPKTLADFGNHRAIHTLINSAIKSFKEGKDTADSEVVTYVEERSKLIKSPEFTNLLSATSGEELRKTISGLDTGKGNFWPSIRAIASALGLPSGQPKKADIKAWNEKGYKDFINIIREASKMLVPDDMKTAKIIKGYDRKGNQVVGIGTTKDVRAHAKALTKLLFAIPDDEKVHFVATSLKTAFAHWGPQISNVGDIAKEEIGSVPRRTVETHNLIKRNIEIISPEYTAENLGEGIGDHLFIIGGQDMQLLNPNGMVTVIRNGQMGVRGRTDAGTVPSARQPKNAMRAVAFSQHWGAVPQHDALVGDGLKDTWFDKATLPQKLYHLATSIVSSDKTKDQTVTKVWGEYMGKGDHKELARALMDLADDTKIQGVRHMAQATLGLALAMDEGLMRRRFEERWGEQSASKDYARAESMFMDQYWDEAVANYNISAQTYWNVGAEKTVIEGHYEGAMSSQFINTFKKESGAHLAEIENLRKARDKFHSLSQTSFSMGGVEALSHERRSEVIKAGLAREIRFNGKKVLAFEFSDAEAYLDTSSVEGQPHMLPFAGMPDAEKAFSDYAFEVRRRAADDRLPKYISRSTPIGRDTTLGKVFGHDTMYYYYPEMKDVKVRWVDGHGGAAVATANGDYIIELGIRSFASAALNVKHDIDGMVFNDHTSLSSKYVAQNPLASVILHEAQHVLQEKAGWFNEHSHIMNMNREVVMGHFANLLGIRSNFSLSDEIGKSMKWNSIWSDAEKTAAKDPAELANRLALAKESPVIREINMKAGTLMKTAIRNFAGIIASEADAGRIDRQLAGKVLEIQAEVSRAELPAEYLSAYKNMMQVREQIRRTNAQYSIKSHFDTEFRAATSALGLVRSVAAIEHSTPEQKALLIRQALEDYIDMDYLLLPEERMARETEDRRMLTQSELQKNPRKFSEDVLPEGSVMAIISNAMKNSDVMTPSELQKGQTKALDAFDTGSRNPVHVVMQSLGGIGEKAEDSKGFALLGKLSLVRYILGKTSEEIDLLNRFAVAERGWTVENGRIVLKTGNYIVSGEYEAAVNKISKKFNGYEVGEGYQSNRYDHKNYVVPFETKQDGTYTLAEILEIAGAKVISEDVISLGNSLMDLVASDEFPPIFKVSEIMPMLAGESSRRYTKEAASAVLLEKVVTSLDGDMVLTKNDLLNIFAYNHFHVRQAYSSSRRGFGVGNVASPEVIARATQGDNPKRLVAGFPMQSRDFAHKALKGSQGEQVFGYDAKDFQIGRFKITGTEYHFTVPELEMFITSEADRAAVREIKQRISKGVTSRFKRETIEKASGTLGDHDLVSAMNERLKRMSYMIKPMLDLFAKDMLDKSASDKAMRSKLALLMLTEIEKGLIRTAPWEGITTFGDENTQRASYVGTASGTTAGNTYVATAIGRYYGKTSILQDLQDVGGPNKFNEYKAPFVIPNMPSIGTLRGGFMLEDLGHSGSPSMAKFSRAETALEIMPSGNLDETVRRAYSDTRGGTMDSNRYLQSVLYGDGVEAASERLAYLHNNWSNEDTMGNITQRLHDTISENDAGLEHVGAIKSEVDGFRAYLSDPEFKWSEYGYGLQTLREIEKGVAAGLTKEAALDALLARLEAKEAEFKKRQTDVASVLKMQLEELQAKAPLHPLNQASGPHQSGKIDHGMMIRTGSTKRTNVAGVAVITSGNDTFVDVDAAIADADAPTTTSLPSFNTDSKIPRHIVIAANRSAFNMEAKVTAMLGSTIFEPVGNQSTPTYFPSMRYDVEMDFLTRSIYNPDARINRADLGGNGKILDGTLFLSTNMFAALNNEAGTSPLVEWALTNKREQITADYQTGGLFDNMQRQSGDPILHPQGSQFNRAVLGNLAAPYILANDMLGYPEVTAGHIKQMRKSLDVGPYHELIAMAETADMRDRAQANEFNRLLSQWMLMVDRDKVSRLLYESSSVNAVDGMVLRLNILQGVKMSKVKPERSAEIVRAVDEGSTYGYDHMYGDSEVYKTGQKQGLTTDVIKYVSDEIRTQGLDTEFWRGYFFGAAALKKVKTKAPLPHTYRRDGAMNVTSPSVVGHMKFRRNLEGRRRATEYGMDVDGVGLEQADTTSPVIASVFGGGKNARREFKASEPRDVKTGLGYATAVDAVESDMYGVIANMAETQYRNYDYIDNAGSFGVQDAWLDSSFEKPQVIGSPEGTKYALPVKARGSRVSARVRRELVVDRLASIASAMGRDTLSVQPARFSAARKQSFQYVGMPYESRRADAFYSGHMQSNSWTGMPFDSSVTAERDKPKVGFAWTRLEDGRIMLNISPDTDVSGYFDGIFSEHYVNALGYSHRRSLGWDVQSKTLIPQSPHTSLPLFAPHTIDWSKWAGRIERGVAQRMDYTSAPVLKQFNLAARAVSKRTLLGRLDGHSRHVGHVSRWNPEQGGVGFNAIARIREGGDALDFGQLDLNDLEQVRQFSNMSDLLMSSSPENTYATIILPKNATMEDIQNAYFTMSAYAYLSLEKNDKVKYSMRHEHYLMRGDADNPWSGQLGSGGAMGPENVNSFTRLLRAHAEKRDASTAGPSNTPTIRGFSNVDTAASGYDPTDLVNKATNQVVRYNPQILTDLQRLGERMTSSESGYFMPDVERGIAMNGDRSAVIELLMPDMPDLQRFAWDSSKKHNLTIIRKSDKSGYMVGHDVISGVSDIGVPTKSRKVMTFRTESEANKYRDTILSGGVEAEVPSALFREGGYQITEHEASKGFGPKSGKADIHAGLVVSDKFLEDSKGGGSFSVYGEEGKFYVGNIDTPFGTLAEAKAAQAMLLKPESITGKAPQKRSVISLSTGGVGQFEHDIRRGLQFGVGGSYFQFAPRALNVLRTALVPMLEKNKSGALKKVKKAAEVATGNEWYEMFVENSVSKNEMRVLGLAEFLYDNKENKLTKMEVAKFLWAMYPQTGRRADEMPASPYLARNNSPTRAVMSAASRLRAQRMKHLKAIEMEIETAAESEKGQMVAYLATVRKMHDEALQSALEQFYEKDAVKQMVENHANGVEDIMKSASEEFPKVTNAKDAVSVDNEGMVRPKNAGEVISEPVLETYRHLFNDAFARAKLEAVGRLAGFDFEIPDFRGRNVHLDVIREWGDNNAEGSVGLSNKTSKTSTLASDITEYPYGITPFTNQPDYAGYTSGIGQYGWDTLHTTMGLDKVNAYIMNLKRMRERVGDNAEEAARLDMQIQSIERIMKVKVNAQMRMGNQGHKNSPRGTMQLGHARHSDVIVTAYHRANANLTEVGNSLNLSRDTIAALGIEELQSDRYQGSTFGPMPDSFLGSDFKGVENSKLLAELETLKNKVLADKDRLETIGHPLQYVQSTVKSKHRQLILDILTDVEVRNATPLLLYSIVKNKSLEGSEAGIRLDYDKTHRVSKETAAKYGLSTEEIPTVVFTENYEGQLHEAVRELVASAEQGDLNYGVMSQVYGFSLGAPMGLAAVDQGTYFHYSTNNSVDNLVRFIAAVGLQFNPEFMGKLDWLGDYYKHELDFDGAARHGVNFDKIALESVLDFRRRVEKLEARTDQVKEWKAKTLYGLKRAEQLYYEPATMITDFRNRRELHSKNYEPWAPEEGAHERAGYLTYKRPYKIEHSHVYNFADNISRHVRMEDLVELGVTPDDIMANMRAIHKKNKYVSGTFVDLTPAQAIAFDVRLAAKVIGVTPEDYIGLVKKKYPERAVIAALMERAITNPDSITFAEMQSGGENIMKLVRSVDIDFDTTSGNPTSRARASQHTEAKTMLGKLFEMNAAPITAVYRANVPDPAMDAVKNRIVEIEKLVGKVEADAYNYPDTIPLGEDGAYRGVMTNWYVMRALQNRKDALVIMDARHHRKRYDSVRNVVGLINLGGGIIAPVNISGFKYSEFMGAGYILHEAKKRATHGGFIEALHNGTLHQLPDAEAFLSNEKTIEWNGKTGLLEEHLLAAAVEIVDELPMVTSAKTTAGMKAVVKSVIDLGLKHNYTFRESETTTLKGLVRASRLGGRTPETIFDAIKRAGITDGEDVAKRVATHITKPQGVFLSVPVGRTHGYATNYGAPLWHNKIYYAGMHDGLINQVSHDAFETPDIVMADGKYSVIDKKTGKPIAEGITSFDEAQERAAQNAKYLGAVPIVSNFLKTYKGMGAYASEAFMLTGQAPSAHAKTMSGKFDISGAPQAKEAFERQRVAAGLAGIEAGNLKNQMSSSFGPNTPTPDLMEFGTNAGLNAEDAIHGLFGPDSGDPAHGSMENSVAMHAMGLRHTSGSEEIAAATAKLVGFTGPMLVIRPRFPTANHTAEARKAIIQGIPFLSLRGVDSNEVMAKEAARMYKFYAMPKQGKKEEER